MDFENFINKYYSNERPAKISNIRFFLNQVENMVVEAKRILGDDVSDKEVYSSLFEDRDKILKFTYTFNKKNLRKMDVGWTKTSLLKSFLLNFIEWLNDQNLIENYDELYTYIQSFTNLGDFLTEENLSRIYFIDLLSVINFINNVGEFYLNKVAAKRKNFDNYNTISDLLNIKVIAVLAWYGFSPSEMLEINKTDIKISGNTYYIDIKPRVYITKFDYNILSLYAQTETYRGIPSGRLVYLAKGDKLIRAGSTTNKEEATDKYIFNTIKRFNQCATNMGSILLLQPKALSKCGAFSKIYELSKNNPENLNKIIREIFNCSNSEGSWQKYYYKKWVNIFHPINK